jgi:hypothetical protein
LLAAQSVGVLIGSPSFIAGKLPFPFGGRRHYVATRKSGSRLLVVDGIAYRWRIRKRATNLQADYGSGTLHVAVQLAEKPGSVLVLYTDHLHPKGHNTEYPIRPSDVAAWIRQAVQADWKAECPGPQFELHTSTAAVKLNRRTKG